MKRALVVWGGPEFHEPEAGAHIVRDLLKPEGFEVTVSNDYHALAADGIGGYDLIVPQITGGELDGDSTKAFCAAIEAGTGLGGFHHALATTFPGNAQFRFMASCTFASHPGNIISYRVDPLKTDDPVMEGIASFEHTSEQYYLHLDQTVEVLATTTFSGAHAAWRRGVKMPVVFKSRYGAGRVFYSALGHRAAELDKPEIRTMLLRGLLWAAR